MVEQGVEKLESQKLSNGRGCAQGPDASGKNGKAQLQQVRLEVFDNTVHVSFALQERDQERLREELSRDLTHLALKIAAEC